MRTAEYKVQYTPPQVGGKGAIKLYVECKEDQVTHHAVCRGADHIEAFTICVNRPSHLVVDCAVRTTVDGRAAQRNAYLKRRKKFRLSTLKETINGTVFNRNLRFKRLVGPHPAIRADK